ncbi:hypothetical protein [Pseudotabrizicola sp. 4114]|uniref:hypothetical protein n=1 Tax=Pseudotabrizicola sp. 4114 TaxID=2817731 RepID=UPI0028574446|nr:hypothetical protein [Pseudorhodobacter sp. 4114]
MTISPDGRITAFDQRDGAVITAAGKVDGMALNLHLRRPVPDSAADEDDRELDLIFRFTLSVKDAQPPPSAKADCRDVVLQTRMIAKPYGSTLSSVTVPVCVSGP